ncbi:MAG TPA: UbiA family prenyltransferase, partial [Ktedonobacterales bacterium]|nr:UbiA family prenyltransferase [Ktedonobacterales bacterium]
LVGWAASTGRIGLPAICMFLIIFLWTPPHFWALSLALRKDYERAGVPMLPVVRGDAETRKQIVIYMVALLLGSLTLYVIGALGWFYLAVALLSGGALLYYSIRLLRSHLLSDARAFFWFSNYYLALLFAAMVIDRFWR